MTEHTKKTAGDLAHVMVKATLSAVPVVGGPAAELFAFLIGEPVSKRRDQWMTEIAERLRDLEERSSEPLIERLRDDAGFTTVLLNASNIAQRNHQEEKITALRNAVLNAALGKLPDDTERAIALGFVDRLTPTHIAILSVMRSPLTNPRVAARLENVMTDGLTLVVFTALPELGGREELVQLMWRDLIDAGLLASVKLNGSMSKSGLGEKRTTSFGDRFLDFVSDPVA